MAGRRKSLGAKVREEALLTAVLAAPTFARAAIAAGVSERTIRRAMKRPDFARRVADARKAASAAAVGGLLSLSEEAHDAVRRALACGVPAIELRAALGVLLDGAIKGGEFLVRLEELERLRDQVAALTERLAGNGGAT